MRIVRKRLIALFISTVMILGTMPVIAFAGEDTTTEFPEWYDSSYIDLGLKMTDAQIDQAIEALLHSMTIEEKYSLLGGNGTGTKYGNAGYLLGVPRLGVPESRMHDGPSGVLSVWPTTNTPNRQMMAATWDTDLAYDYGVVYGSENRAIGANIQLGAQFDITRTPEFGRAKDQLGEDPYLLSQLATQETLGMQGQGVIAVAKHYAVFSEAATPAAKTDIQISEQGMHETYLPGFEYPVKDGNLLGVMSSYNAINGEYASAHEYLQKDVLRDMWGYKGFTVTDWGGNHEFTLDKGTDIEMASLTNNTYTKTVENIPDEAERNAVINNAVGNVLYSLGHAGYLYLVESYEIDGVFYAKEEPARTKAIKINADSSDAIEALREQNNDIVLNIARGGGVLLENKDETLPVKEEESVAVLGLGGMNVMSGTGGERSYGVGFEMISPYKKLKEILGEDKVTAEPVFDTVGTVIPQENLYYLVSPDTDAVTFEQGVYRVGGDVAVIDDIIEFLPDEESYFGGDTFENGEAYTWTTYVKAEESGQHTIILHGIGGDVSAVVTTVGVKDADEAVAKKDLPTSKVTVSYSASQGAQWHSGDICTDTGMSISSGLKVNMEAGNYYKVVVTGTANQTAKNLQLRLAWLTPSTSGDAAYERALELSEENDKVIVFVSATAGDIPSTRNPENLNLSKQDEQLILDVAERAHSAGNRVIVVINNETAITMHNWIEAVDAVLMMYKPGQRGGVATAELLTGIVNPSGKLAYVIPAEGNQTLITYNQDVFNQQTGASDEDDGDKEEITRETIEKMTDGEVERMISQYQMLSFFGVKDKASLLAQLDGGMGSMILSILNGGGGFGSNTKPNYYEGILTGYRWYDTYGQDNDISPRYDFGYGLSYTTFEYSDLSVLANAANGESCGYDVTFTVKNTGSVKGSEVAQIYIGQADLSLLPKGIQSAPVQLVGFNKVKDLEPSESRKVTIHLDERALSYWDSTRSDDDLITYSDGSSGKWTVASGDRKIYVAAASDNLLLSDTVTPTKDFDTDIPVTGVTLNKSELSLKVDAAETLVATVEPSNSSNKAVKWTSSDSSVATVTDAGNVKAIGVGTAIITVETIDGGKSATCKVTVTKSSSGGSSGGSSGSSGGTKTTPITPSEQANRFKDLGSYGWAQEAINALAEKGIINGLTETTYGPGKNISRADFLTLLVRTLNLKADVRTNFADVRESDYYYDALGTAKELGITTGVGDNKFHPKGEITRQEMMVLVERALRIAGKLTKEGSVEDLHNFSDVSLISGYAGNSIAALVNSGIIQGNNNLIDPLGTTTRAEVAVLLYRIYTNN